MTTERWPCVTARCLTDDLGLALPDPQVERRADLAHDVIDKLKNLAPSFPATQDPVAVLRDAGLPAFRFKIGDFRSCTWLERPENIDPQCDVVWLLATAWRRDGDTDDAYNVFAGLHSAGRLKPSVGDYKTLQSELLFHHQIPEAARELSAAIDHRLINPDLTTTFESVTLIPIMAMVDVIVVEEDTTNGMLAEIIIAFFHSAKFNNQIAPTIHALVIDEVARMHALPPAYEWERARGYERFPAAESIYVCTTEL